MARVHGERPVTLIGYSMGARLIFHALLTMAEHHGGAARGLVDDVILLGGGGCPRHSINVCSYCTWTPLPPLALCSCKLPQGRVRGQRERDASACIRRHQAFALAPAL